MSTPASIRRSASNPGSPASTGGRAPSGGREVELQQKVEPGPHGCPVRHEGNNSRATGSEPAGYRARDGVKRPGVHDRPATGRDRWLRRRGQIAGGPQPHQCWRGRGPAEGNPGLGPPLERGEPARRESCQVADR